MCWFVWLCIRSTRFGDRFHMRNHQMIRKHIHKYLLEKREREDAAPWLQAITFQFPLKEHCGQRRIIKCKVTGKCSVQPSLLVQKNPQFSEILNLANNPQVAEYRDASRQYRIPTSIPEPSSDLVPAPHRVLNASGIRESRVIPGIPGTDPLTYISSCSFPSLGAE